MLPDINEDRGMPTRRVLDMQRDGFSERDISARLEQEKLLGGIQADYFIQSLRFNDKDYSGLNSLKLVYENKSINIFKILK